MANTINACESSVHCYHCGELCNQSFHFDDKTFCCNGCQSVYQILYNNQLCTYYSLSNKPGLNQKVFTKNSYYDFLDQPEVIDQLIHYKEDSSLHISFTIPNMHCSSCIWLLENLYKINPGVQSSVVNFLNKQINLVFDAKQISLKELVCLLKQIGYEPQLSMQDLESKGQQTIKRTWLYKLVVAGFVFGNTMMLSLPDYFAKGNFLNDSTLGLYFNYLTLVLSVPVLVYSAQEFFLSAWQHLKQKKLNIDTPIALALIIIYLVSIHAIVIQHRMGYLDSLSGIVFFMLLGRYFQTKSYSVLNFNKKYSSYLPIAVTKWNNKKEESIAIKDLNIGDDVLIRQHEIVPADAILIHHEAWFDYSFVTGESQWIKKVKNETIYAGAQLKSGVATLKVSKKPSASYLSQLWNQQNNAKQDDKLLVTEKINFYFSIAVLSIGIIASLYWLLQHQHARAFTALITVWIVACPCALLLSSTFTYGSILHFLNKKGVYIKNASLIEKIKHLKVILFDKTGTLTTTEKPEIEFIPLVQKNIAWNEIASLTHLSIHPLSKAITSYLKPSSIFDVSQYESKTGEGIHGVVNKNFYQIGSAKWLQIDEQSENHFSKVYVVQNGNVEGYFEIKNQYRKGIAPLIFSLRKQYELFVLSGDNDAEKNRLQSWFKKGHLYFDQKPEQKNAFVIKQQNQGFTTMMIGDGLNDTAAFEQSDIAVAVVDNKNNVLPACDMIVQEQSLLKLDTLLAYANKSNAILRISFIISILYNAIGLYFAVQGKLLPVIAAILMPLSTISIVGICFGLAWFYAKKIKT
ncbi:MAG: heavy metal translocating P-type ATPase metal-binding domain-containing protein [Chitinophagaceae bacterium]